jgi:hypothetical protein
MRPRDTVLRMREWLLDRDVRHQSLAVLDESYIELERRNADRQRAREGLERALGHETRPPRWGPARQAHPVRRRAGMRRRGAAMGRQHHRRDLGQPARSRGRYPTTSPIGITCGPCSCSSPTSRTWALEHTRGRPLTLSSASFSVGSLGLPNIRPNRRAAYGRGMTARRRLAVCVEPRRGSEQPPLAVVQADVRPAVLVPHCRSRPTRRKGPGQRRAEAAPDRNATWAAASRTSRADAGS